MIIKRFKGYEKGQGLVEYGLILALVSVVAVGALGGVGEKVTNTFNLASSIDIAIDDKIEQGYIPVATADELNSMTLGESRLFGKGTYWEKEYLPTLDGEYVLVADIDMGSIIDFEPIGDMVNPFTGSFSGEGHTINKLSINQPNNNAVGLFGSASNATFDNVHLKNVTVTGKDFVGGLVGSQKEGTVDSCSMDGAIVSRGNYSGGLIGIQSGSSVSNSYGESDMNGANYVGGLVGAQKNNSEIIGSHTISSIISLGVRDGNIYSSHAGGLVGHQGDSVVSNSYAKTKIDGKGYYNGGLIGRQTDSEVLNSYATGDVVGGANDVGGLVGQQVRSSIINSYANVVVLGKGRYVGGLVGIQWYNSEISNSYAVGPVLDGHSVGGLVGGSSIGGAAQGPLTTASYYNRDTTGQNHSAGGIGKTTDEMKNKETYVEWDFDNAWQIVDGEYPILR